MDVQPRRMFKRDECFLLTVFVDLYEIMAALPNIGGALCSTPQSLADAHYQKCRAVTLPIGLGETR